MSLPITNSVGAKQRGSPKKEAKIKHAAKNTGLSNDKFQNIASTLTGSPRKNLKKVPTVQKDRPKNPKIIIKNTGKSLHSNHSGLPIR